MSKVDRYWDADNTPPPKDPSEFKQLIGEEADPNLSYEYDCNTNVVRIYNKKPMRFRVLWILGELVVLLGLTAVMVLAAWPILEGYSLWSNIGHDFFVLWLLFVIPILVMGEKIKSRFIKKEFLYEINVDQNNARKFNKSNKIAVTTVAIICVAMLFTISETYTLTYLRFLTDGGYSSATIARGEIDDKFRFDDSTSTIVGKIKGTPGDVEHIKLFLEVDKCPDEVSVYINGEKANIDESDYRRFSWHFYDKIYFRNRILADVGFQAREINTLKIQAGDFQKEWTFKAEVAGRCTKNLSFGTFLKLILARGFMNI